MGLRLVRFRYISHGPDGPEQYGLSAEEVQEVAPELVDHDKDGQINSVYYDKVNAILLNEVQKQYRLLKVQEQQLQSQDERIQQLELRLAEMERARK
jgi:hypothetical protein